MASVDGEYHVEKNIADFQSYRSNLPQVQKCSDHICKEVVDGPMKMSRVEGDPTRMTPTRWDVTLVSVDLGFWHAKGIRTCANKRLIYEYSYSVMNDEQSSCSEYKFNVLVHSSYGLFHPEPTYRRDMWPQYSKI
jgi:hypothetical protein